MPAPSALDNLTPEQRTALDHEITRRNFADYDGLVAWLSEQGLEISRSTAARHGNKLKRRLQQVKDAAEGSRLLAAEVNDDANLLSGSIIAMLQSELFNIMLSMQELDETTSIEKRAKLLKDLTLSIKGCALVSFDQKEYERLYKERAEKDATAKMEVAVKKAGLSNEDWAAIRANFLGIDVEKPLVIEAQV